MKFKNYYIMRVLRSYLPILFVTISILIFIFISIINQLNVRNAAQANRMTAKYVVNMVDTSLKNISYDAQKMTEESILKEFLNDPSNRSLNFEVSNKLNNLISRYWLIDSIYFYRAKDNTVLDQSAIRPLEEFPDKDYTKSSLEMPYSRVWTTPRIKTTEDIQTDVEQRVISLGIKVPRDSGSLGYLIINVKTATLDFYIGQMIDNTITEAEVYDSKGASILEENQVVSANNRLSVAIVSDYTDWTYHIGLKGGKLLDFLSHGSTVWIFLGLGAIAFAIGSTFYVTRKNYKPIEKIMHRIERFSTSMRVADNKDNTNEFAFIDQAIERLITNNMAFQEQRQEDMVIRRQKFLLTLLKGEFDNTGTIWEQERNHFGLSSGYSITAILELDNYVQFGLVYSQNDQSLFKFIISSVALEIAEQHSQRIVVEWISRNQLVILLKSEEDDSLEQLMLQLSEQIRLWVESHLNFTVTIGIGLVANDEYAIAHSFSQASIAVTRKVSLGINRVIAALNVQERTDGEWFAYLEMFRTIVRELRMCEPGWRTTLKQVFYEMATHCLHKADVDRLLDYFIFHLEYELERTLPEAFYTYNHDTKSYLLNTIGQSDTLQQLEDAFEEVLGRLAKHIEELSQSWRHKELMKNIRDYVAENYLDPDLTLSSVSVKFMLTPKYFSHLFKESIGQNFSDFLIGLRINYAKKLLQESNETIQDISQLLGYSNPTSFIRTFKKLVGVSPGQYREAWLENKE